MLSVKWAMRSGSRNCGVHIVATCGRFWVFPAPSPQTHMCSHPGAGGLNIPWLLCSVFPSWEQAVRIFKKFNFQIIFKFLLKHCWWVPKQWWVSTVITELGSGMPFLQAEMFQFHNEKLEENLEFIVSNRYRKCHFWPQPSEHMAGNTLLICIVCWERKAIKLVSRAPLPRINSGVFVSQVNTKRDTFWNLSVNMEK